MFTAASIFILSGNIFILLGSYRLRKDTDLYYLSFMFGSLALLLGAVLLVIAIIHAI